MLLHLASTYSNMSGRIWCFYIIIVFSDCMILEGRIFTQYRPNPCIKNELGLAEQCSLVLWFIQLGGECFSSNHAAWSAKCIGEVCPHIYQVYAGASEESKTYLTWILWNNTPFLFYCLIMCCFMIMKDQSLYFEMSIYWRSSSYTGVYSIDIPRDTLKLSLCTGQANYKII